MFSLKGTIVEKECSTSNPHWGGIRIPWDFPWALPLGNPLEYLYLPTVDWRYTTD